MIKKDLSLQRLKNTSFPIVYREFLVTKELNIEIDYKAILSIAILLINSEDIHIKKLGYSIIVTYCNRTGDYYPLYEISINMGLFPISKFISNLVYKENFKESLFLNLNDSFMELYGKDDIYQSYEQKNLINYFNNCIDSNLSIIAPTSYGKTDLIITLIKERINSNICIITPTKSLLAQTKQRVLNAKIKGINKIISHPEMYQKNDTNIIAVLTQERLLRLLKKNLSLTFDFIIVDEAHNLLSKDDRDVLLATVIILLINRNPKLVIKFLTPFLAEAKNLQIKYTNLHFKDYNVNEFIKSEKFYLYEYENGNGILHLYDQYLNQFYEIKSGLIYDDISFVETHKSKKNIIYLNKPIDIENFAYKLAGVRSPLVNRKIIKACKDLSKFIHPNYNLIDYIRKGIIYHHGAVPDSIRLYVEHLYTSIDEIVYVITSSTLLEGVNLPADRMFILDNKKGIENLSPSNFKNLIGRVCRFSDIFKEDSDLNKLSPHIYLINSPYTSKNSNLKGFLMNVAKIDKKIKDDPQNVLLKETVIEDDNKESFINALEFIENNEEGIIKTDYDIKFAKTEAGKLCFSNNLTEINIFEIEETLQREVDILIRENYSINSSKDLMFIMNDLFFSRISDNDFGSNRQNLIRLQNKIARNFYEMFLNWRINKASFSEMIGYFIRYWNKLINDDKGTLVFVGRWGDKPFGGHKKYWTDIKEKNEKEKINLAIVRIKEEQDFLDNVIIKYIEVLNDFGLLEKSFYQKIKYGTDDEQKIVLIKNGLSLSLANIIIDKYKEYTYIDVENSTIEFKGAIIKEMRSKDENDVLIYELTYYIND